MIRLHTRLRGWVELTMCLEEAGSCQKTSVYFPKQCWESVNHTHSFLYESSSHQAGVGFVFQNLFKCYKIFHQPSGRRLKRPGKAEHFPQSAKLYACRYLFFSFLFSLECPRKRKFFLEVWCLQDNTDSSFERLSFVLMRNLYQQAPNWVMPIQSRVSLTEVLDVSQRT